MVSSGGSRLRQYKSFDCQRIPNALFGVAKKTRHDGPRFAALDRNCCANVALSEVMHRFLDERRDCGKNRLLSVSGMAKIG